MRVCPDLVFHFLPLPFYEFAGSSGGWGSGNDYQQGYGGGPVRNSFGGNRSAPYGSGGKIYPSSFIPFKSLVFQCLG